MKKVNVPIISAIAILVSFWAWIVFIFADARALLGGAIATAVMVLFYFRAPKAKDENQNRIKLLLMYVIGMIVTVLVNIKLDVVMTSCIVTGILMPLLTLAIAYNYYNVITNKY